jgi:hypothetical protein
LIWKQSWQKVSKKTAQDPRSVTSSHDIFLIIFIRTI